MAWVGRPEGEKRQQIVGAGGGVSLDQGGDWKVGQVVGMDDQKTLVFEPGSVRQDRSTGPKEFGFVDEIDAIAPPRGGDKSLHRLMQVMGVDERPGYLSLLE